LGKGGTLSGGAAIERSVREELSMSMEIVAVSVELRHDKPLFKSRSSAAIAGIRDQHIFMPVLGAKQ
jgi:hypothetical protein